MLSILLVDDEPLVLAGMARGLRGRARVTLASSASEAMTKLGEEELDAVVSDYWMPQEDGLTLLARVRVAFPRARRVLVSAGVVPNLDAALASGAIHAFFEKPFTPAQLLAALKD